MKNIISIVLLLLAVHIGSCQNSASQSAGGTVKTTLEVADFSSKINSTPSAIVLDVRTPGEFAAGHLPNAININVNGSDFDRQVAKLDKAKPILVYCKAGSRSATAADKMQDMGFREIYNLSGGIMKWESAGKPVTTAATPVPSGLTVDAFTKLVNQKNYVLVDYNAHWCVPCQKMLPVLQNLAALKKDKLTLTQVDADENKDLLKQKNISSIPYLELYNNGKLVWSHEGYIEEADLLKATGL